MDIIKLENKLRKLSPREIFHQKDGQMSDYYQRLDTITINKEHVYVFDNLIPEGQHFSVVKHTRFVPVPLHIHSFIELNYIYSGNCTQIIAKRKVELQQGQICLIDTAVPHSIETTGKDDIIINVLIHKDYFAKKFLSGNFDGGIVYDFVLNALSNRQTHNQYIVFNNHQDKQIRTTLQHIIYETYYPEIGSHKIIEHLIAILFTQLVREFDYETNKITKQSKLKMKDILMIIEQDYLSITLPKLAEALNYTPTYISSFIKKETGKTFSELVLELKLEYASVLITNTEKPIYVCAEEAGFSNITYFYQKFKKRFNHLPGEMIHKDS